MGAGIFGMIIPFDSMMNSAPRYMNEFAGTGALNPLSMEDAVDMIEYLKANPYVLDAVQGHYDYLARKRLSIFDPDRAVKDIEAIALDAFQGGNYFHHVHNSTELIGNSKVYAGLLGRGNGGASEFGDDAASQDGGAPDLISSDDESEELGAAGTSGG
jgi:hypothetical protein